MSNLVGKTFLNRYNIQEFLGRGGMAEVYKVWDGERAVHLAMKVLHADLAQDKVFLRRFKREASNLAKLQHPHIVRFYGLERHGLHVFMLMDYVDGESLKTRIFRKDEPFTLDEAKRIIRPVASALHYAHNSGLVHCDIKPANIMLDTSDNVRLADFGIARMSDTATATMVGAGTPAYMAPEQILGEDPTPQSDIYALGIVLYEMLTGGERPFTGEHATITGSTSEKVRWEQRNIAPPSPLQWNAEISPAVEKVILKCLEKDASLRYASALDFLNALELATEEGEEVPLLLEVVSDEIPPDEEDAQVSEPEASVQDEAESGLEQAENQPNADPSQSPRAERHKKRWLPIIGIFLILAALIAGFILFQPNTPLPFLPSPTFTKTRTPVPTQTRVPPTATSAPPMMVNEYLTNVRVQKVDRFYSAAGWTMETGKIAGGVLEIVGKDWNGLGRRGSFSEGSGAVVNFKASRGAEFKTFFDYGSFETSNYRRFGIYYLDAYPQTNLWFGPNQVPTKSLTGNLSAKSETWYTLLMVSDRDGELFIAVWEKDDPSKSATYHETNEKWAGYTWQFRIGANQGTIVFDDFMEITFADIK